MVPVHARCCEIGIIESRHKHTTCFSPPHATFSILHMAGPSIHLLMLILILMICIYVLEKPPKLLQIAAQREQLTAEESPVAVSRPGKGAGALDKKSKAEPRPPNEPHTANVGSATVLPPGQREAPVGREESVKPPAVQAAPHRPAQATVQAYGTGTGSSSRNKLGTGM